MLPPFCDINNVIVTYIYFYVHVVAIPVIQKSCHGILNEQVIEK